jgi:hypothetical protein
MLGQQSIRMRLNVQSEHKWNKVEKFVEGGVLSGEGTKVLRNQQLLKTIHLKSYNTKLCPVLYLLKYSGTVEMPTFKTE